MRDFLAHLFIPKESNNHRAKILHHANLLLTIVFLFLTSFFIQTVKVKFPSVLGIQADISSDQLLFLTNKDRQDVGLGSLFLNDKLSQAASAKADDMFEYNYWAHNSPSGKTPWSFITSADYKYVYAGENLARGFTTAESVINAWMASPDHRANMLSANYRDVGFAVKLGKLNGEDTVLVVEEFGNLYMPIANSRTQDIAAAKDTSIPAIPMVQKNVQIQAVSKNPLISTSILSSNIYFMFVFIFIFALILDMIIVEKNKIMRFVGHNIDHILYLILILVLVGVWTKGIII